MGCVKVGGFEMRFCGLFIIEKSHLGRNGLGKLVRDNYWNVTDDEKRYGYIADSYDEALKQAIWVSHFHRNGRVCLNAGRNLK